MRKINILKLAMWIPIFFISLYILMWEEFSLVTVLLVLSNLFCVMICMKDVMLDKQKWNSTNHDEVSDEAVFTLEEIFTLKEMIISSDKNRAIGYIDGVVSPQNLDGYICGIHCF